MRLTIRYAVPEDEPSVVELWRACDLVASYNDPAADFRFARAGVCSDVLVGEAGRIIGSVMVGHDGHRGWALLHRGKSPCARHRRRAADGRVRRSGCASAEWSKFNFCCGRRTPRWLAFMSA